MPKGKPYDKKMADKKRETKIKKKQMKKGK